MSPLAWYDLGPLSRIPAGEGRAFKVEDLEIAVFRGREGRVYATQASCPHRGGPLADGLVGGGCVICPLHAFTFDLATGRPRGNDCTPLTTHRIAVADTGHLLLALDHVPACEGSASR
ncbi:MAG: Rieske (2Fe-2S) protein [Gemmatimonadales bacterium]